MADGDTITVYIQYVDTAYPRESGNLPREVQEAAAGRIKSREAKNYQKADALQKIIVDATYRQVLNLRGEHVLAKNYRIRLRCIDAQENSMPYGKKAKEDLVKLVQGRTLKITEYMILAGTVDWLEMFTATGGSGPVCVAKPREAMGVEEGEAHEEMASQSAVTCVTKKSLSSVFSPRSPRPEQMLHSL